MSTSQNHPLASKTDALAPSAVSRYGLVLAAIGVVFGDIGTSPLYALKECFNPEHGIPLTPEATLGVISMLFWAIFIVVALKYILFVMSADNKGEGGC